MEQLVLQQFSLLPENLKMEVLHFIQFLIQKRPVPASAPTEKKSTKLTFADFHFPENGQTYSRSEIYGDDGR